MQKPKVCLFCGRGSPEVKISGEHVIRAKLHEYFPRLTSISKEDRYLATNGAVKERSLKIPKGPFESVVNEVCKPCNEGWLNVELEIPVEPLLVAFMYGQRVQLSVENARLLALWAAKTGSIRALTDPGVRAIPADHYRFMKDAREPPPGTHVWIANTEPVWDTFTRHSRFSIEFEKMRGTGHLTTIMLGHLCFYVAGFQWPEVADQILDETISRLDSHDTLRIWPAPRISNWPSGLMPLSIARSLTNFVVPSFAERVPGKVEMFDL